MLTPMLPPAWPAVVIWIFFAAGLHFLDGWWSLGNLALLLVLCSTLASYWLSTATSVLISAVAVAAFNWFLVEPRYTFHVQFDQDVLLLITMLGTSAFISALTSRLRQHVREQTEHARQAERLQQLGAELQHAHSVEKQIESATHLLREWTNLPVQIWLQDLSPDPESPLYRAWMASQQESGVMGPGSGRYESLDSWLVPMRCGVHRIGTLCLGPSAVQQKPAIGVLERIQPMVRLLANEIQRLQSDLQAREAQQRLQSQQLRNTLLAAISHDYRTPLASITGAASGLLDEQDIQRVRLLAKTILQESAYLHRVTSNTLEMARLDTIDAGLHTSWESLEELCGVALAATRPRHPGRVLDASVQSSLPLLKCDPVLVVQLLDNLLENALRYSPDDSPVELSVDQVADILSIRVMDRGIGIPAAWKEKVFDPFRRVLPEADSGFSSFTRRGMGLGLALCQSIARVHGASIWIADRDGGGTVVHVQFQIEKQPVVAEDKSAMERVA